MRANLLPPNAAPPAGGLKVTKKVIPTKKLKLRLLIIHMSDNHKKILSIFTLLLFTAAIPLTAFIATQKTQTQTTQSRAAVERTPIILALNPQEIETAVDENFEVKPVLIVPQERKVGSIILSITFDPAKLKYVDYEKKEDTESLKVFKITDETSANQTGRLKILIGATSNENAPKGRINLPNVTFMYKGPDESYIEDDASQTQVVFLNEGQAQIDVRNKVTVKLASLSTPTPSQNPSPTPTPSPTPLPRRDNITPPQIFY